MKNSVSLIFAVSLMTSLGTTPAHADEASAAASGALQLRADGSVTVSGVTYADMTAYHRSDAFRHTGHRCGTTASPTASFATPSDCNSTSTSILPEYDPMSGVEILVVFHAITDSNGIGAVTDELVHSQIDILNEDYQALAGTPGEPGTDSGIKFVLASVDPNGQPTDGILRYADDTLFNDPLGNLVRPLLAWDTSRYLNIFSHRLTVGMADIQGYATFPWDALGSANDGVSIHWHNVGRDAPDGGLYNQGRTGTHEVGHYLGLYHTFEPEGECSDPDNPYTTGDLIADTQPESDYAVFCFDGFQSCGGNNRPLKNYMNYTQDTCLDHFTPEQINRMRCTIINYRSTLLNTVPVADFLFNAQGRALSFTSMAADEDGQIVEWMWDFGDGATATETNPSHTYEAYGNYEVTLTVTDDRGSQATGTATVLANDSPEAGFDYEADGRSVQFNDASADLQGPVASWLWDFGDGNTSTESSPRHVFAVQGTYPVQLTVADADGAEASVTDYVTVLEADGCGCVVGSAHQDGDTPLGGLLLLLLGALVLFRGRSSNTRTGDTK